MKRLALFFLVATAFLAQVPQPGPIAGNGTGGGGGSTGTGGVYCPGTGTNVITCTGSPVPSSYTTGMTVSLLAGGTNTGATTLNISSLGAKNVLVNGNALTTGLLVSGSTYNLFYDGTQFQVVSTGATILPLAFQLASVPGGITNETSNWVTPGGYAAGLSSCQIVAAVAPTGSSMIVDVLDNGTSIFGANPKPTVALNSTSVSTVAVFSTTSIGATDVLVAKLTQNDSSGVGQFVAVKCFANISGGTGPIGPQGPSGPTGPTGSAGTNGGSINFQSQQSPITGNSTDQTLYTYTLAANALASSACLTVSWGIQLTTGTATGTLKFWFGSASTTIQSGSGDTTIWSSSAVVCNITTGTQQTMLGTVFYNFGQSVAGNGSVVTSSVDTTSAVVIKLTTNHPNSNATTPVWWMVAAGGSFQ